MTKRSFLMLSGLVVSCALLTAACNSSSPAGWILTAAKGQPAARLARSGQVVTYGTGTLDDGGLQKGIAWPDPRFKLTYCDGSAACASQGADCDAIPENDVVTDNLTGLMWRRTPINVNPGLTAIPWSTALSVADSSSLCGYSDWRLPNRTELMSLVDYSQKSPALPAGHPFTEVKHAMLDVPAVYWTSTSVNATTAMLVHFAYGRYETDFKNTDGNIWLIRTAGTGSIALPQTGQVVSYGTGSFDDGGLRRGAAWPDPRFVAGTGAEADCATDTLTRLTWVKAPASTLLTWQEALDGADALNLCGHSDWRLPNVKEMESLSHAGVAGETSCGGPCTSLAAWLNTQAFSNLQADFYWTSTTYSTTTSQQWVGQLYEYGFSAPDSGPTHPAWYVRD